MDVTMLQKIALDLNSIAAEIFSYADKADDTELMELSSELRNKIMSLSFQLGCLDEAMRKE